MAINRFSRVTPAQFTPRTLDEIMMIPLAKQQQHLASEESLGKLTEFDFDRVAGDDPLSTQELTKYRQKVDSAVDELSKSGVSGLNKQLIKDLDRELKRNMAPTGKWGKRKAYYDAQQAWVKEMHTKDARGEWSQRDASRFMAQETEGKSSQDAEGIDTPFSPSYLPEKVDVGETFDKILRTIGENSSDPKLKSVLSAGYKTFFESTTLTGKDKNKIWGTVKNAMLNDKTFLESYAMQNRVSDFSEENPFAMGEFNEEGQYQPASQLDSYIYSRAVGASSTKASVRGFTYTDDAALYNYKKQLDRQYKALDVDPSGMININSQVLEQMTPDEFAGISEKVEEGKAAIEVQRLQLDNYQGDKDSNEYRNMKTAHNRDVINYQNLSGQLEDSRQRAIDNLDPNTRANYEALKEYEALTQGTEEEMKANLASALGEDPEFFDLDALKDKFLADRGAIKREHAYSATQPLHHNIGDLRGIEAQIDKEAIELLKKDAKIGGGSTIANSIGSDNSSTYNKVTNDVLSSLEGSNFNSTGWSMANGSGLLSEIHPEFFEPGSEVDLKKTKVELLDTTDKDGNGKFIVRFMDKDGFDIDYKIVTKGATGNALFSRVGKDLLNSSDPQSRQMGERFIYNQLDPDLRASGIYNNQPNSTGTVPALEFDGKPIKWDKATGVSGRAYYTLDIKGVTSEQLSSPADVNRYITLLDDMYSSGDSTKFISTFGEDEYLKYTK